MKGTRYLRATARAVKFEILVWEWITQGLFSFTNLLTILYERLRLTGVFSVERGVYMLYSVFTQLVRVYAAG